MTNKPSGFHLRRKRREAEAKERAERLAHIQFDIDLLQRIIGQMDEHDPNDKSEIARLSVKVRTLQQRMRYIGKELSNA